jgi:protoheme IX farnesyltransferase
MAPDAGTRQRVRDYVALTKPRVVLMVLLTAAAGWYLGGAGSNATLAAMLAGVGLAAGGTMALNQYMERERDAHMARTKARPLPAGRLAAGEALVFGLGILVAGVAGLAVAVGQLPALLTAVVAITYLLCYTPLKGVTSLCTIVGAIPGALPPVIGWSAATGTLGVEPLVLFAIMFLWQIPHTLAIGCLYRDDYERAGILVLPVIDRGSTTAVHSVMHCLALLPVALMPTIFGFAGGLYFVAALALGVAFLWAAVGLARFDTSWAARRLLRVSLVYLPLLLGVLAVDRIPLLP